MATVGLFELLYMCAHESKIEGLPYFLPLTRDFDFKQPLVQKRFTKL